MRNADFAGFKADLRGFDYEKRAICAFFGF